MLRKLSGPPLLRTSLTSSYAVPHMRYAQLSKAKGRDLSSWPSHRSTKLKNELSVHGFACRRALLHNTYSIPLTKGDNVTINAMNYEYKL